MTLSAVVGTRDWRDTHTEAFASSCPPSACRPQVLEKLHAPPADEEVPVVDPHAINEADGFAFGFPTRFGMMAAQMKAFFDATGQVRSRFGFSMLGQLKMHLHHPHATSCCPSSQNSTGPRARWWARPPPCSPPPPLRCAVPTAKRGAAMAVHVCAHPWRKRRSTAGTAPQRGRAQQPISSFPMRAATEPPAAAGRGHGDHDHDLCDAAGPPRDDLRAAR